jgi:hypothetical protein
MTTEKTVPVAYACLTSDKARKLAAELLRLADKVEQAATVGIAGAYAYVREHELTAETGEADIRVRFRISNDRPDRS